MTDLHSQQAALCCHSISVGISFTFRMHRALLARSSNPKRSTPNQVVPGSAKVTVAWRTVNYVCGKRYPRPDAIITDRLRSYRAALRELGGSGLHQAGRWLNNRAENSHLPFRRREHAMLRFRRMRSLQKFATVHSVVYNHFNLRRSLCSRDNFKLNRAGALVQWRQRRTQTC